MDWPSQPMWIFFNSWTDQKTTRGNLGLGIVVRTSGITILFLFLFFLILKFFICE